MPRKGENIYKRKDGRWEGRYICRRTTDGKAVYKSLYAKSYRDLKEKMIIAKQSQQESMIDSGSSTIVNYADLADKWFKSKEYQIKESSRIKYKNMLQNYILPTFSKLDINSITHETIETFVNEMLTVGGSKKTGLSEKTVADIISIMRSIEKYAVLHGIMTTPFCIDISIRQKASTLCVLSIDEEEMLIKYLKENMNYRNYGIYLCLFTGIRIGELCALTWQDISVQDRILYIHSTMQRIQVDDPSSVRKTRIMISSPKSSCSIRMIPLAENILEIISNMFNQEEGYILTGDYEKYIEPRAMEYYFQRVCEACNLRKVNFHTLRHTFATRCIEAGCDIKSLSEILGHSCVNMTMNRYVHPSMNQKRKSIELHSCLFAVKN